MSNTNYIFNSKKYRELIEAFPVYITHYDKGIYGFLANSMIMNPRGIGDDDVLLVQNEKKCGYWAEFCFKYVDTLMSPLTNIGYEPGVRGGNPIIDKVGG